MYLNAWWTQRHQTTFRSTKISQPLFSMKSTSNLRYLHTLLMFTIKTSSHSINNCYHLSKVYIIWIRILKVIWIICRKWLGNAGWPCLLNSTRSGLRPGYWQSGLSCSRSAGCWIKIYRWSDVFLSSSVRLSCRWWLSLEALVWCRRTQLIGCRILGLALI